MSLRKLVTEYIIYRRALGAKFRGNGFYLEAFCKMAGNNCLIESITETVTEQFTFGDTRTITTGCFRRHNALNGFFRYALARGYIKNIPLQSQLPKYVSNFTPYIYSKEELKLLFSTALTCKRPKSLTSGTTIRMMLLLTYTLGLRKMETVSIRLRDINLTESFIIIAAAKFNKTRMVTFNQQLMEEIEKYLLWRKAHDLSQDEESHLFLNQRNKPVEGHVFYDAFERIRKESGIKREDGAYCQPRIHDLRHTFAVNRLTAWYRENQDMQNLLPVLSTYMGHVQLSNTSVYLTMTDELLQEANYRFENYAIKKNHGEEE